MPGETFQKLWFCGCTIVAKPHNETQSGNDKKLHLKIAIVINEHDTTGLSFIHEREREEDQHRI